MKGGERAGEEAGNGGDVCVCVRVLYVVVVVVVVSWW